MVTKRMVEALITRGGGGDGKGLGEITGGWALGRRVFQGEFLFRRLVLQAVVGLSERLFCPLLWKVLGQTAKSRISRWVRTSKSISEDILCLFVCLSVCGLCGVVLFHLFLRYLTIGDTVRTTATTRITNHNDFYFCCYCYFLLLFLFSGATVFGLWLPRSSGCGYHASSERGATVFGPWLSTTRLRGVVPQSSGCGCHDLRVVATTHLRGVVPQSSGCGCHDLRVVATMRLRGVVLQSSGCGCHDLRVVATMRLRGVVLQSSVCLWLARSSGCGYHAPLAAL